MNENINIENKQENEINGFSSEIFEDITNGFHSVLFKRINTVVINDIRLQKAFRAFTSNVECGESFSIIEMLTAAEKLFIGDKIDVNAGNEIYIIDDFKNLNKRTLKKVLASSVEGVYTLFSFNNGIMLDIDLVGGSLSAAETKRFLVASPSKMLKLKRLFAKSNVSCEKVGELISSNKIVISRGDEVIAEVDKQFINSGNERTSVNLTQDDFDAFLSGYNSALSIELCDTVSTNNVVRFGLSGSVSSVFAKALGYFTAMTSQKKTAVKYIFVPEEECSVAVSRPNVSDGDYLYLLRVRNDMFAMPDKAHYAQLKFYLSEKKKTGVIKNILPVRNNIQGVFKKLANKNLAYVPISENVEYAFGVIVTVGRGESVNGVKLGYYKTISDEPNMNCEATV